LALCSFVDRILEAPNPERRPDSGHSSGELPARVARVRHGRTSGLPAEVPEHWQYPLGDAVGELRHGRVIGGKLVTCSVWADQATSAFRSRPEAA